MLRIRIVSAGIVAAIAVVAAVSNAAARTAPNGLAPPTVLAGLPPPHESKAIVHAIAGKSNKKTAFTPAAKTATKLTSKKHNKIAAMQAAEPPARSASDAPPANVWPVAAATPPADIATATPPEPAPPDNAPALGAIVVGGQTVQVAASDQVNDIDLAAAAANNAATPAARSDRSAHAAPAQTVFAAPRHEATEAVGSTSWIAQMLAALGGAVAAASVAWFLIGSAPVRTYG